LDEKKVNRLKNKKIILITGMSRGGTNIVWNMVQSHPQVVSTERELTAAILDANRLKMRNFLALTLSNPVVRLPLIKNLVASWLDNLLFERKRRALKDPYSSQKYEGVLYKADEVDDAVLCLKAPNRDMYLVDLLQSMYPEVYVVNVIRNCYAICDSWKRRGVTVERSGTLYDHYTRTMLAMEKRLPHVRLWKFEDVLADPFGKAEEIFAFAKLEPLTIPKLRVKSKAIVNEAGEVKTPYGGTGAKNWYDRDTIAKVIVPHQSTLQAQRLSPQERETFERYAASIMQELGYN
jgi:hypothetical protein